MPEAHSNTDWSPYDDRVQFELADFLYRRNQMSGGDIDFILSLWEATLISQNNHSPFRNHEDLHEKNRCNNTWQSPMAEDHNLKQQTIT